MTAVEPRPASAHPAAAGELGAWAYFEPGTGSMLLQLLIGGIAGSLFVVKLYFGRFKSFLLRRPQKPQQ